MQALETGDSNSSRGSLTVCETWGNSSVSSVFTLKMGLVIIPTSWGCYCEGWGGNDTCHMLRPDLGAP